jgi:hypothetical protein
MKQLACSGIGLVLVLGLLGLPAAAQNQAPSNTPSSSSGSSLGDYARQVRKDPQAKAKPKVFDNDNLPNDNKLSIVGPAPAADAAPAPNTGTSEAPKPAVEPTPADKTAKSLEASDAEKAAATKQWTDKMTAQKEQIDLLGRELDVLQREYQVRAAAMYADAGNRMRNSGDWDKQDAQYKQQIADKQKALDDAKQKLDDMQEEARKAGVSAQAREQVTQ